MGVADPAGGTDALVLERGRHPHVHHCEIGDVLADRRPEPIRVLDGGHHLVAAVLEQPPEALSQQDLVLCDHDSQGSSASTRVPDLGGLSIRRLPPSAATRSAMPISPEPPAARAPPTPSSRTVTTRLPLCFAAVSTTSVARACLAALASASLATK